MSKASNEELAITAIFYNAGSLNDRAWSLQLAPPTNPHHAPACIPEIEAFAKLILRDIRKVRRYALKGKAA